MLKLTPKNYKNLLYYCAGIIDGEGSIYISKCKDKDKRFPVYQGLLVVRMTTPAPLKILKKMFGGTLKVYNWLGKRSKYKPYWHWCTYGERAAKIAEILLPLLTVKKKQAKLLLRFRKTVRPGSGHSYSLKERRIKEKFRLAMRKLNA